MFTNQVSIKDLFSTTGLNASRHDGSGDWDHENTSSGNSQQPYSQLDYPDSQEFPSSQNLSQKESNSPSKFYQRYIAKGLHNRENVQKPSNQQPKPSFQQQLDTNKARARERDERDLLNRMLNLLKECGNEVKEAVSEVKATLEKGSTSADERLAEHLSKIDAALEENAEEYRKALEIKQKTSDENVAFREQLNEKTILITELQGRITKMEKENEKLFIDKMEEMFTKNSDNLKHCLEELFDGHKKELLKFASLHSDQQKELVKKQEHMAKSYISSLKTLEDRIDNGLARTVGKILEESQKIFSVQGGDIVQIQQEQLVKLKVVLQREMVACIMNQMSEFKEEISRSLQRNSGIQGHLKTSEEAQEEDIKRRYTQEMEALKRRFQDEANEIYSSQSAPSKYGDSRVEKSLSTHVPSLKRNSFTSEYEVADSTRSSGRDLDYQKQTGFLSPNINVIDPAEMISGRISTQSDPVLRNMFSQSKDQVFRSPMSSMGNSWSSNLLYRKNNQSPVATVKPQLQEAQPPSSTKTTSYPKRKGKGKQNTSAPKRPKSKRNRKDDEPTIVKEYPLRGRNSGDKEWNNELRSDSETYLPGRQQDTAHQAKHGNNESKMTHLARYSEIYTFQSTPRQSLSKINSDSYYGEEKQPRCYGGRPSVIERRSDVLAFENDSPLGTDETSQIRNQMSDERWEAVRAVGPVAIHGRGLDLDLCQSGSDEDENLECASQTSSPCMSVLEVVKRSIKQRRIVPRITPERSSIVQRTTNKAWTHLESSVGDADEPAMEYNRGVDPALKNRTQLSTGAKPSKRRRKKRY